MEISEISAAVVSSEISEHQRKIQNFTTFLLYPSIIIGMYSMTISVSVIICFISEMIATRGFFPGIVTLRMQ